MDVKITMRHNLSRCMAAIVVLLSVLSLTSCSDDNGMDDSLSLYQQYYVLIQNNEKIAGANFRIGTPAGARVELTNGSSIYCNAMEMVYLESISDDDPEYNYLIGLYPNHQKAIFTFHRAKNRTYVNTVEFNILPDINLSSVSTVSNGTSFTVDKGEGEFGQYQLTATLSNSGSRYNLTAFPDGTIHIDNVPSGYYTLTVDATIEIPTQENDGNALGSITLTKRVTRSSVQVN